MKKDIVLQTLKQKDAELTKQFGVKSLLLFGSVARNEATASSDADLLVEFNRPVVHPGRRRDRKASWLPGAYANNLTYERKQMTITCERTD